MLTQHQTEISDQVIQALYSGQRRIILQGAAGVGKTYLAGEFIKRVRKDYRVNPQYNNGMVYVTAPTNKAMAVLKGKVESLPNVEFKTVHSALKLKRVINGKTGQAKFIPGYSKSDRRTDFNDCRIAFVDECSMLNTELLDLLEDYKFPIVFIGDGNQINPVGELDTPVFNRGYPVFELTEIIRQGAGNPIIDLSRDIDMLYFKKPALVDGKGYVYNNMKGSLIEDLAEVNGTDEIKYLSWTNMDVDEMNRLTRERIYGKPNKVEHKETLVFNTPLGEHYTNKEVKVEELDIVTDYVLVPTYATKFDRNDMPINDLQKIKMRYYRINNSFNVMHEDSMGLYGEIVSSLRHNCVKMGWNWKAYFYFAEMFADIKYNHAISIHKSQGSTYKQAIINIGNVNFNKNAYEKQRLLYTGITRASDLVVLYNVQ